ncbi:MAG: hypothetical protein GKR89_15100 [Candidatus Latescibacteria bacterium]|nr:hypothetical protein [Candidatus Latescibacterota bacterium]
MSQIQENSNQTLTDAQIAHFHERGYISLGPLLEADLVEELRAEYDRLFAQAREDGGYRNLSLGDTDDVAAKREAPEQMLQIMQMCERSLVFRQLLYHGAILDRVQDLIGPNIQLFHDQALYKPAHHGGPVFWHQDNAYWKCAPANLVSCWITLDDVDVANGAMHLMPGSHLIARPDHERSNSTSSLLDYGDKVDEADAVAIELPAGGALLHHCQTLHYTPPNHTERQRRAFVIHCMTPGTRSRHSGEFLTVSFGRPMLRMHL